MAPCIFEDNFDLLVVLNRLGSRTDFLKELTKSKIWFALGRKEILMSVSDFYNSVTPGSSLSHGTGTGVYTIVETKDAASSTTYENEKLPMENKDGSSLLNEVKNFFAQSSQFSTFFRLKNHPYDSKTYFMMTWGVSSGGSPLNS